MEIFANLETISSMPVDALGVFVSDFMKHLVTNSRFSRGPDGKHHHYQEPCILLQQFVNCRVPPDVARDATTTLIRKVSTCYAELINGECFRSACEEIAPYVLKAVIHPSVNCLDFLSDVAHPTLLNYFKDVNVDLIYRTLPLLRDLKELKIGYMTSFPRVPLDVEGFKHTLKTFSTRHFLRRDLETLANKCTQIRCLDLGGRINNNGRIFNFLSRFIYLEELNLSLLRFLSSDDLQLILSWLAGIVPLYEGSSDGSGDIPKCTEVSSNISVKALREESAQKKSARNVGQLKSFGCANATAEHIYLISMFCNLTSLVLCDITPPCSLAPLRQLKMLKNFTLMRSHFSGAEEFLKAIGNQLICLNIVDVIGTKFICINEMCRCLECLHLCFSCSESLILPANYRAFHSNSLPSPIFPNVFTLQLHLTDHYELRYIINHFPNLRKLAVILRVKDFLLLDSLINRTLLQRLEELYWGTDTVMIFSERRH